MDNLDKTFGVDLSILRGFRREAETLTNTICEQELMLGQRVLFNQNLRCDAHVWLEELMQPSCPKNFE